MAQYEVTCNQEGYDFVRSLTLNIGDIFYISGTNYVVTYTSEMEASEKAGSLLTAIIANCPGSTFTPVTPPPPVDFEYTTPIILSDKELEYQSVSDNERDPYVLTSDDQVSQPFENTIPALGDSPTLFDHMFEGLRDNRASSNAQIQAMNNQADAMNNMANAIANLTAQMQVDSQNHQTAINSILSAIKQAMPTTNVTVTNNNDYSGLESKLETANSYYEIIATQAETANTHREAIVDSSERQAKVSDELMKESSFIDGDGDSIAITGNSIQIADYKNAYTAKYRDDQNTFNDQDEIEEDLLDIDSFMDKIIPDWLNNASDTVQDFINYNDITIPNYEKGDVFSSFDEDSNLIIDNQETINTNLNIGTLNWSLENGNN
jgi:hypothetical protein